MMLFRAGVPDRRLIAFFLAAASAVPKAAGDQTRKPISSAEQVGHLGQPAEPQGCHWLYDRSRSASPCENGS